MQEFDLAIPTSLLQALDALSAADPSVQPLAGGTDMIVNVRARLVHPRLLVALNGLNELCEIRREDGHIIVGGGVTVADFLRHPLLLEHADLVRQSATVFANPMIRNLATVAGNIASASPAADLAPPLLALRADVQLMSKAGARTVPLDEFFLGPRKTARGADELITALRWPVRPANSAGAFYKLGLRQADAISLVSVAVMLERDGDTCRSARIALGAVAPRPIRARAAEGKLEGQAWSETAVAEAARAASEECSPMDDLRGSASYRRRMVRVLVERCLRKAWTGTKA